MVKFLTVKFSFKVMENLKAEQEAPALYSNRSGAVKKLQEKVLRLLKLAKGLGKEKKMVKNQKKSNKQR